MKSQASPEKNPKMNLLNCAWTHSPTGEIEFSDLNTRGHSKKLVKPRALKSFRQNSFCVRVIDKWNALPDDMVNTSTVLSFKTMYDRYMGDQKYQTGEIY